MKTIILSLLAGLLCSYGAAQQSDTIYVNEKGTTTLLFPHQVGLVEIGNANFAAQPDGKVVLIKALGPSEGLTNLLIRFGVDHYFTGYIGYNKATKQRYYDFRPDQVDSVQGVRDEPKPRIKASEAAEMLNRYRPGLDTLPMKKVTKDQICVSLLSIQNGPELTYVWLRVDNLTALPYHVRKVNVQYRVKARTRRLDDQLVRRPLIAAQIPETVKPYGREYLCFAIPHYASGRRSRLEILIGEKTGNRVVMLPLRNSFVINAQILNTDESPES